MERLPGGSFRLLRTAPLRGENTGDQRERTSNYVRYRDPTQLTGLRATIGGGIALEPGEVIALNAHFLSAGDPRIGARVFNVDAQQFGSDELIGGVRFVLRTEPAFRPLYECGPGGRPLAGPLDGDNFIGGAQQGASVGDCGARR